MWLELKKMMLTGTQMPDRILVSGVSVGAIFIVLMVYFAVKSFVRRKGLDEAFTYIVYALARAAEANDEETGNHIMRVGDFCAILAKELGMPKGYVQDIRLQAVLHDVGKVHIPPQVLRKKQALTPEEWKIVREHPLYGAMIVGNHPRLAIGRNIALTHHENYDGTGYPCGLKGEEIPLEGQIISIADHYDALRSARSYKPAYDHETACRIITKGNENLSTKQFSPRVLSAFLKLESKFAQTYDQQEDNFVKKTFAENLCPAK